MEDEQNPERPEGQIAERRASPRFEVEEDASLLLVSHDSWHPCRVVDLSLDGCRIRTDQPFRAGIGKHVELRFKINGLAFRLSGTTQWTDEGHAVGIRFSYPTRRRQEELEEVLREVEADQAARAQRAAEEKLAQHPAALIDFQDERLEPEDLRCAAEFPANDSALPQEPSQPLPVPDAEPPRGRERRTEPRQEVDTSASIFLLHLGYPVHGRILNLSRGGCGIRTGEPFPLGIYTRVEVEFHLEGQPFRLGGVIQFIYERNLVGIRFLDLGERKREQVDQLMIDLELLYATQHVSSIESDPEPAER